MNTYSISMIHICIIDNIIMLHNCVYITYDKLKHGSNLIRHYESHCVGIRHRYREIFSL